MSNRSVVFSPPGWQNTPTPTYTPTSTPTNTPTPTSTPTANLALSHLIYDDQLNGWNNWSWNTTITPSNSTPVYRGSHSLAVKYNLGWAGLQLQRNNVSLALYSDLRFYIHGGSEGSLQIKLELRDANDNSGGDVLLDNYIEPEHHVVAGQWRGGGSYQPQRGLQLATAQRK